MSDPPRGINPRLIGLVMAFAGIMISMAATMIGIRVAVFIGVFISITGMFFVAAYPMLRSSFKRQKKTALPQESLPNAPTTKKLSPIGDFEYVPVSVTESTTNLLKEPAQNTTPK